MKRKHTQKKSANRPFTGVPVRMVKTWFGIWMPTKSKKAIPTYKRI